MTKRVWVKTAASLTGVFIVSMALPVLAASDAVVAIVNGSEIHQSDLTELRKTLPESVAKQMTPFRLADIAITNKLVIEDARRGGMTTDPSVKKAIKGAEEQGLLQVWAQKKGKIREDDATLKSRYDEMVKAYEGQEEVSVHHILSETEEQAQAIIIELKEGAKFEDVAKAKSKDPTATTNGGDIGFFTKQELVPEFTNAAFALKQGELTEHPVKTQYGWHVIRLDERRQSSPPPFDQVKDDLRQRAAQETLQKALDALRTKAKIEMKVSVDTVNYP